MKKFLKGKIEIVIAIIITSVVTSITSIFAYTLIADNIGFTPKDLNWNVENVDAALNDLNVRSKELTSTYSTDETEVGRWIDGKKLYQKTIYIESATIASWTRYFIDTTNLLDNENIVVIDLRGGYYADFGATYQQYHNWGSGFVNNNFNTFYGYIVHYRQAEKEIVLDGTWGGLTYTIKKLSFTLQYYKTNE